ncbi:Hypothetical_protein [Hexamita inflata]|uniref:Hypothetical_protein n=1 Tax=Hexamita inflata TaxID=28002 RepID=A0AA86PMD6_9EUKA|nr:Hypothetical protein HINF_LOCUS28542 [Hexamita inflata]
MTTITAAPSPATSNVHSISAPTNAQAAITRDPDHPQASSMNQKHPNQILKHKDPTQFFESGPPHQISKLFLTFPTAHSTQTIIQNHTKQSTQSTKVAPNRTNTLYSLKRLHYILRPSPNLSGQFDPRAQTGAKHYRRPTYKFQLHPPNHPKWPRPQPLKFSSRPTAAKTHHTLSQRQPSLYPKTELKPNQRPLKNQLVEPQTKLSQIEICPMSTTLCFHGVASPVSSIFRVHSTKDGIVLDILQTSLAYEPRQLQLANQASQRAPDLTKRTITSQSAKQSYAPNYFPHPTLLQLYIHTPTSRQLPQLIRGVKNKIFQYPYFTIIQYPPHIHQHLYTTLSQHNHHPATPQSTPPRPPHPRQPPPPRPRSHAAAPGHRACSPRWSRVEQWQWQGVVVQWQQQGVVVRSSKEQWRRGERRQEQDHGIPPHPGPHTHASLPHPGPAATQQHQGTGPVVPGGPVSSGSGKEQWRRGERETPPPDTTGYHHHTGPLTGWGSRGLGTRVMVEGRESQGEGERVMEEGKSDGGKEGWRERGMEGKRDGGKEGILRNQQ